MLYKSFLTGLALATGVTAASAENVTLRLAHFAAETHPGHLASVQFAENVAARTGGEVTVELYPANQLGSPPEQLEQTIIGAVDMNLPTARFVEIRRFSTRPWSGPKARV